MKIIFSIVLFAFLLIPLTSAAAQDEASPPPPDYYPKFWKEYTFDDDGIRFKFPVQPRAVGSTTGTEKLTTHVYERRSFMFFQLTVVLFPADRDVEAEKTYLQSFVNGGLARLKDLEPKVLVEQDLSVDGHAGKFMKVETNDGMVVRSKYFAVKYRLYIAYAISKKGDRHGFNWENDFEIPAMAFLDSLRPESAK